MKQALYAIVAGAFALALYACTASVKMQAGPATPFVGGSTVDLEFKGGQPATCQPKPTDTVPPGTCVKITFTDGAGNPIGGGEATVGGDPIPVPDGAEGVTVSPCEPKPDPKDKTKESDGVVIEELVADQIRPYFFRHMPVPGASTTGRFVDFVVRAIDHDAADAIAFRFLRRGPLTLLDPSVEVFNNVIVSVGDDARVFCSMLTQSVPTSLPYFDWNGNRVASSLAQVKVSRVNGWYLTTVIVPSRFVDVLPTGATNELSFALSTRDRELSLTASVDVRL